LEYRTYSGGVELQRCSDCLGLFVAPGVLLQMRQQWMTEAFIDVGHPSLGRRYNPVDDIQCPECQVGMTRITDPVQTHIWLESCPQCHKVFLDAGEFTDLKFETLLDKLKGLFAGQREK
jgi:Zn-finger nucleic acid-binding protein